MKAFPTAVSFWCSCSHACACRVNACFSGKALRFKPLYQEICHVFPYVRRLWKTLPDIFSATSPPPPMLFFPGWGANALRRQPRRLRSHPRPARTDTSVRPVLFVSNRTNPDANRFWTLNSSRRLGWKHCMGHESLSEGTRGLLAASAPYHKAFDSIA